MIVWCNDCLLWLCVEWSFPLKMDKERKGKNCVLFGSVHGNCNIAKRIFLPFTFLFVLEFNF